MFNGKTIDFLDNTATNIWFFYFTDGTAVSVELENTPLVQLVAKLIGEVDKDDLCQHSWGV
ncbi:MAG: hypothetical protein ACRDHZ_12150 [Ktedonobacteraceae bacterium]